MAEIKNDLWTAVDRYIDDTLLEDDDVLEQALRASDAAGLPAISVSPSQGRLLFLLAKATGARRILEIGTLGGYSTIWLGRALGDDGRLVTIEVDPKHAAVARGNIEHAGLAQKVELRVGPAQAVLADLVRAGATFDFVFIDADKGSYAEYLDWSVKLARVGTLIIADNVIRDGEVANAGSTDPLVQGVRRFMAALGADRRLAGTAVQAVGAKGYDGYAVALVTRR